MRQQSNRYKLLADQDQIIPAKTKSKSAWSNGVTKFGYCCDVITRQDTGSTCNMPLLHRKLFDGEPGLYTGCSGRSHALSQREKPLSQTWKMFKRTRWTLTGEGRPHFREKVSANTKCYYTNLEKYTRILLPFDTVCKCGYFLSRRTQNHKIKLGN